jgi:hypothetical protein
MIGLPQVKGSRWERAMIKQIATLLIVLVFAGPAFAQRKPEASKPEATKPEPFKPALCTYKNFIYSQGAKICVSNGHWQECLKEGYWGDPGITAACDKVVPY